MKEKGKGLCKIIVGKIIVGKIIVGKIIVARIRMSCTVTFLSSRDNRAKLANLLAEY